MRLKKRRANRERFYHRHADPADAGFQHLRLYVERFRNKFGMTTIGNLHNQHSGVILSRVGASETGVSLYKYHSNN